MNNIRYVIGITLLLLFASAEAQTRIIYVNGVQNTKKDTWETAKRIAKTLTDSTNRSNSEKRLFAIDYIWNPKGFYESSVDIPGCSSACQDNGELFVLKAAEEDYSIFFPGILAPHSISNSLNVTSAKAVKLYADSLVRGTNSAISSGFITADRMAATKKVVYSLAIEMQKVVPKIVVAHSQGNLLANLAWATTVAEVGQEARRRVRLVNIANTSRFAVNGLNLTHDADDALFALAVLGKFAPYTRTTLTCNDSCFFELAAPTFAHLGSFSCGLVPLCNHFMDTYLSNDVIPNELVFQGVPFTLGKTRFVDRFEDLVYVAASSLDLENTPAIQVEPVTLPFVYGGITFNHAFRFATVHDGAVHTCYFSTAGSEPKQSGITYPSPYIGFESGAMYSPDGESCGGTYLAPNVRILIFYTSPPHCSDGTCGQAMACPLSTATWSSFRVDIPSWWDSAGTNICGRLYFPGDRLY